MEPRSSKIASAGRKRYETGLSLPPPALDKKMTWELMIMDRNMHD